MLEYSIVGVAPSTALVPGPLSSLSQRPGGKLSTEIFKRVEVFYPLVPWDVGDWSACGAEPNAGDLGGRAGPLPAAPIPAPAPEEKAAPPLRFRSKAPVLERQRGVSADPDVAEMGLRDAPGCKDGQHRPQSPSTSHLR